MARYYRPDVGRFINADTVLGKTGALLSHNAFAYCENSPVIMADPSGHTAIGAQGFQTGIVYVDIPIAVLMSIWIYSGKFSMQGSDSYALGSSIVLRKPTDEMIGGLRSALDAAKSQMEAKREKKYQIEIQIKGICTT